MPIYEYRCQACGHELEAMQKLTDEPLKDCPACGKAELKKLISAVGFQLKGTGWYATDFKGGSAKKSDTGSDGGSDSSGSKPGGCGSGTCGCA